MLKFYKIVFFVPVGPKNFEEKIKEEIKERLFELGLGEYDKYNKCSFETLGYGQFGPLEGSNPYIGKEDEIIKIREYRVEIVCRKDLINNAIRELITIHPYDEPVYEIHKFYHNI